MKRSMLLTVAMMLVFGLSAQTQETLTGKARVKGGFGGPFFVYSQVGKHHGGGAGGGGAAIINDFFFGGFGQGENFGRHMINGREYELNFGYGGLWLGYTYPSHKLVHLYTSLKIGWGGANLNLNEDDFPLGKDYNDDAFVVAPEVGVELNIARWFRIVGHGGYRFVNGVENLPGYANADFNSPTFGLTLRFGGFGYAE